LDLEGAWLPRGGKLLVRPCMTFGNSPGCGCTRTRISIAKCGQEPRQKLMLVTILQP